MASASSSKQCHAPHAHLVFDFEDQVLALALALAHIKDLLKNLCARVHKINPKYILLLINW
jgi:hypothetical protein